MPIEFYCPGCGNLMRTPDETAGRKGRCPTCQLKVQIPGSSVTANSSETAVPRTATTATAARKQPEPIRLDCRSCGQTLSIAAANAGKKGQCPHCGELMSIPLKSPAAGERWKGTPTPKPTASPAAKMNPTLIRAGGEKIEFHCSSCHEVVSVGAAGAGKKGQCPRCKAVVQIPLKSTSVPGLQPIPSNKPASPRPQTQAATAIRGLTPLSSEPPASSGLTAFDAFDALSPLEPLGLTPLGPTGASLPASGTVEFDFVRSDAAEGDNPFANGSNRHSTSGRTVQRPTQTQSGSRSSAEVTTMICGGILGFYGLLQLIVVWITFAMGSGLYYVPHQAAERFERDDGIAATYVAGSIVSVILLSLAGATMVAGGIQMIRFKVWGLCLAACILTITPFNCMCTFGIPIGVWGTIMLSLGSVRSAFR